MNWINAWISREDLHHLLDRFQISKTTGFSHDYQSTRLSSLMTNLWLVGQDWIEIVLSSEDIEWIMQKLSIPYEQFLRNQLRNFQEKMSQKYPDEILRDIDEDYLIRVLVSLVSQRIDEFESDISALRDVLEQYNNWNIDAEQVRELLGRIRVKYFSTVTCWDYSRQIQAKISWVLAN